jgi:ATP-binding cassette, subfamily D (ALD), peroxisomal long-chain fatty acid import protein
MKPALDMVIFTAQISRSLGPLGSIFLWANYLVSSSLLRSVTPAFARMAAVEVSLDQFSPLDFPCSNFPQSRLEGEYRGGVARAGREAEEIA